MFRHSRSRTAALVFCVALSLTAFATASAQPKPATQPRQPLALDPLTPQERQAAEKIARADPKVREVTGDQQRLIYIAFVAGKPAEDAPPQRQAQLVFYRADGNYGIRVLVALQPKTSVIEVERIDASDVPYNDEDIDQARKLVLQHAELQRILGPEMKNYMIEGLGIVATDKSDSCFGHRCLQILFRRANDYFANLDVVADLTAQTVRIQGRPQ